MKTRKELEKYGLVVSIKDWSPKAKKNYHKFLKDLNKIQKKHSGQG